MWHRYYTWLFETELKNECGYKGTQPVCPHSYIFVNVVMNTTDGPQYWDYGRWESDILSSPMFDGSDTSLGGNGAPRSTVQQQRSTAGKNKRQGWGGGGGFGGGGFGGGGDGGGCVETGPFKE